MDRVQAQTEAHLDNVLEHRARRPVAVGRTHCEDVECREPIAPLRVALGAQLCVECAQVEEQRNAQHRRRGA